MEAAGGGEGLGALAATGPGGLGAALSVPAALPPLLISGLVVTKAALVACLRLYVPQVADIAVLDSGERFLLRLGDVDQAVTVTRRGETLGNPL